MAPGRVREHVEVADVTAKPLEQRDTAIRAEGRDGLAGARVERVEPPSGRHEDAAIVTALPEDDPAVHAERTDALAAAPPPANGSNTHNSRPVAASSANVFSAADVP